MNAQWRLDSKAASLADAFRAATRAKQWAATRVACEMAIAAAGLVGDDVESALRQVRDERSIDPALQGRIDDLAAQLDDEYFRLAEAGDDAVKPEMFRFFSKARAASALSRALSGDDTQLHEAIYEALSSALADDGALMRAVESSLR